MYPYVSKSESIHYNHVYERNVSRFWARKIEARAASPCVTHWRCFRAEISRQSVDEAVYESVAPDCNHTAVQALQATHQTTIITKKFMTEIQECILRHGLLWRQRLWMTCSEWWHTHRSNVDVAHADTCRDHVTNTEHAVTLRALVIKQHIVQIQD